LRPRFIWKALDARLEMVSMKVASLIVALALALAPGAPARTAPLPGAASPVIQRPATDAAPPSAAPGPSSYLLLALGLFGMGLVSRRRRSD
jgi:hypothetical protein